MWNRLWTFRAQRGHVGAQGGVFSSSRSQRSAQISFSFSSSSRVGARPRLGQAIAIVLVTPLNFIGNKLWSFRRGQDIAFAGEAPPLPRQLFCSRLPPLRLRSRREGRRLRRRRRSTTTTAAHPDAVRPEAARQPQHSRLEALHIFEQYPKVAAWLTRYPVKGRTTTRLRPRASSGHLDLVGSSGRDRARDCLRPDGAVTEAWTGPQVAWGMARGSPARSAARDQRPGSGARSASSSCSDSATGNGRSRSAISTSSSFCRRRCRSGPSTRAVFAAVPLFYPCLVWVVLRGIRIGTQNRGTPGAPRWPVWVLIAATIFLVGFRVGLNIERSNVIDVGYSGVIGAERIVHGQAPWGNFPQETTKRNGDPKTCSKTDTEMRIQTDGAASARTRSATRTARPRTRRTSPAISSSAGPGSGTTSRRRT